MSLRGLLIAGCVALAVVAGTFVGLRLWSDLPRALVTAIGLSAVGWLTIYLSVKAIDKD